MVVSVFTLNVTISLQAIKSLLTFRGSADMPGMAEMERKGIIALHGEVPEFDGYYEITEIGKLLLKEIKKGFAVVDGELRNHMIVSRETNGGG